MGRCVLYVWRTGRKLDLTAITVKSYVRLFCVGSPRDAGRHVCGHDHITTAIAIATAAARARARKALSREQTGAGTRWPPAPAPPCAHGFGYYRAWLCVGYESQYHLAFWLWR